MMAIVLLGAGMVGAGVFCVVVGAAGIIVGVQILTDLVK